MNLKKIILKNKAMLVLIFILIFIQMVISSIYPYFTKIIINNLININSNNKLSYTIILMIIIFFIQIPINILVNYLGTKWCQNVSFNIRDNIIKKFISNKYNTNNTATIINNITDDSENITSQLFSILMTFLPNIILTFLYIVALYSLNIYLSNILVLILPIFLLFSFITSKKTFYYSDIIYGFRDKIVDFLNKFIKNRKIIKIYKIEDGEYKKFNELSVRYRNKSIVLNTIVSAFENLTLLISNATPLFILIIGVDLVINKKLDIGSLIAINTYSALLFSPISKLLTIPNKVAQYKVFYNRINNLYFESSNQVDGEFSISNSNQIIIKNFNPIINGHRLFNIPISLKINSNENIYIYGDNGIGKSIFLSSLIGYWNSYDGSIQSIHNIVYVPQENFVFDGSVLENITKGIKNYDIDTIKKIMDILNFNVSLEKHIETDNITLSSGELQKIKIIRSILKKPDIIIIDEAFSNIYKSDVVSIIKFLNNQSIHLIFTYHGNIDFMKEYIPIREIDFNNYI